MVTKKEAEEQADKVKETATDKVNEWCADYGDLYGKEDCLDCPIASLCAAIQNSR